MKTQLLKLWKSYNEKVGIETCIRIYSDGSGIISDDHITQSDMGDENRLI